MWVVFVSHFDFDPPEYHGNVTVSFEAGEVRFVRGVCARLAIKRGKALRVDRPADARKESA